MSGRSTGLQIAVFTGARVAGTLSFVPQHTKNGKLISARCDIPVYVNSHKGTNAKTGQSGRVDSYKVTAWGKLAETCCKSCPPGKALDLIVRPQSYSGRLFDANGNQRIDNMGAAIEVPKVGYTIVEIAFGEDSAKHVADEIQRGIRPMQWNIQGTPDWQMWTQTLQNRQQIQWDGQSNTFGYARVTIPQGQGIALDFSKPAPRNAAPVNTAPVNAAPAYTGYVAPNAGYATPEQAVTAAFTPAAPVMAHAAAPMMAPAPMAAAGGRLF